MFEKESLEIISKAIADYVPGNKEKLIALVGAIHKSNDRNFKTVLESLNYEQLKLLSELSSNPKVAELFLQGRVELIKEAFELAKESVLELESEDAKLGSEPLDLNLYRLDILLKEHTTAEQNQKLRYSIENDIVQIINTSNQRQFLAQHGFLEENQEQKLQKIMMERIETINQDRVRDLFSEDGIVLQPSDKIIEALQDYCRPSSRPKDGKKQLLENRIKWSLSSDFQAALDKVDDNHIMQLDKLIQESPGILNQEKTEKFKDFMQERVMLQEALNSQDNHQKRAILSSLNPRVLRK